MHLRHFWKEGDSNAVQNKFVLGQLSVKLNSSINSQRHFYKKLRYCVPGTLLYDRLHSENLKERRHFLTWPLDPFSQITAALGMPLVGTELQSIWESINLREYRVKTISQNVLQMASHERGCVGLLGWGLRCWLVFLSRTHPTSSQPCWTKIVSFSWKRALNILKNNKSFVMNPDFEPLAREELRCGQM